MEKARRPRIAWNVPAQPDFRSRGPHVRVVGGKRVSRDCQWATPKHVISTCAVFAIEDQKRSLKCLGMVIKMQILLCFCSGKPLTCEALSQHEMKKGSPISARENQRQLDGGGFKGVPHLDSSVPICPLLCFLGPSRFLRDFPDLLRDFPIRGRGRKEG